MLRDYIEDFDADAYIERMMAEKCITKTAALAICREKIPKETYFQNKIIQALKKRYPEAFVVKIAQGSYSQGGIPDVMVIMHGHYFGFEVKRPVVGEVTPLQNAIMEQIASSGGSVMAVRWPEEAIELIESIKDREGWM